MLVDTLKTGGAYSLAMEACRGGLPFVRRRHYRIKGIHISVFVSVIVSPLKWHVIYYDRPNIGGDMDEFVRIHSPVL